MENKLRRAILPTFKGDEKGYPFWRRRIENYFKQDNLLYVFQNTPLDEVYAFSVPGAKPDEEDHRKAQFAKRVKDDMQVVNDLMMCLDDEPMGHILDCEYAKEIIDKLDEIYLPKGPNAMLGIRSKLFLLKNRRFKSLHDLFSAHEDLVRQLNVMGEIISHAEQISTLLAAIPDKYNHILGALSVMRKDELMQMSLLQVKRIFLDADVGKPEASDNPPVAFKMGNNRWKKIKQKRKEHLKATKCYECGKLGHVRKYCVVYRHRLSSDPRYNSERERRVFRDVALLTNE